MLGIKPCYIRVCWVTKTSPGRSRSGVLVKEMATGELSEKQETKVWKWHLLACAIVFSVVTGGWRLSLQNIQMFLWEGTSSFFMSWHWGVLKKHSGHFWCSLALLPALIVGTLSPAGSYSHSKLIQTLIAGVILGLSYLFQFLNKVRGCKCEADNCCEGDSGSDHRD